MQPHRGFLWWNNFWQLALLGYKDLLPCTSGRVGTAVVVEVSYNKSADPNSYFWAEIIFIAKDEWRVELKQLFRDLEEEPSADNDDEGPDTERNNRTAQTFDKVKSVYPHLKNLDSLKSISIDDLLNDPQVQNNFGITRRISKSTKTEFSSEIRSYIDSGNRNSKKSAP